ncbi:hypothetical protein L9F63_024818, partial [Diploptera punctata]
YSIYSFYLFLGQVQATINLFSVYPCTPSCSYLITPMIVQIHDASRQHRILAPPLCFLGLHIFIILMPIFINFNGPNYNNNFRSMQNDSENVIIVKYFKLLIFLHSSANIDNIRTAVLELISIIN